MLKIGSLVSSALDGVLSNKARVAMIVVTAAAVAGVKLSGPEADTLVTLAAFVVWLLEEASRMAAKAKQPAAPAAAPVAPAPPA